MPRLDEWLAIDPDGFAQRQADRPPAHLVKELLQNALDAVEGLSDGCVTLQADHDGEACRLTVTDNGPGLENPLDLRTVFSTGKEDRETLRGRMGLGFKEILCLAREAEVRSRTIRVRFHHDQGRRVTDLEPLPAPVPGTTVHMLLPWPPTVIPDLVAYCRTLLVPATCTLTVNGEPIPFRPAARSLPATLRTEGFANGRWHRRPRRGQVDLVPLRPGETATLYEMGLPICPAEWTQPYHLNVQQRVPMNPRRDAVAAGYLAELYAELLPHLLPELTGQALRDEWVSLAVERSPAPIQREVVHQAFGPRAVRSVPTAGGHDWDADARELGFRPIDTSLLPRGLRTAARQVLKSAREVELERRQAVAAAAPCPPVALTPRQIRATAWARWLIQAVLGIRAQVEVVPELVLHGRRCDAAWEVGHRLLLSQQAHAFWRDPLGPESLGLLIHEIAHARAAHHGDDFRHAVETLAGRAARVCLDRAEEIRAQFGDLLSSLTEVPSCRTTSGRPTGRPSGRRPGTAPGP